jgi:peptide-methionine (S)-S-oxide reductase
MRSKQMTVHIFAPSGYNIAEDVMLLDTLRNVMLVALVVAALFAGGCDGERRGNPGREQMTEIKHSEAVFAAGCFWGVEARFRSVKGVVDAKVGFIGGTVANPTYKQVCRTDTGHAEAVRVVFDPSMVSYEQLLETFWSCHNPTTLNRQGPDVGSQYRSAIFFYSPEQQKLAESSRDVTQASGRFSGEIVTEIAPAGEFYLAEEYHQRYFEKNGGAACNTGIQKD